MGAKSKNYQARVIILVMTDSLVANEPFHQKQLLVKILIKHLCEKYKSNEDFKGKGLTKKRNMERGGQQGAAFLFKASVSSQAVDKRVSNWVVKRTRKRKLELRAHRGPGALGNTPVTLQNLKLRKEGNSSDTRKVIPDGSLAKQKGMKSNKKGS